MNINKLENNFQMTIVAEFKKKMITMKNLKLLK